MNQVGFVEISHIKNDHIYRSILPMGVPWSEALDGLREISEQVANHIAELETIEANKKEDQPAREALAENDQVIEIAPE